jgi:hypothetical protein
MNAVGSVLALVFATLAVAAHAGEASGTLTLAGTTIELKAAVAVASGGDNPRKLILLSDQSAPLETALKAALATDNPFLELETDSALRRVNLVELTVSPAFTLITARKAGDPFPYVASSKFGLDAKVSGGDGMPLKGRLRSTDKDMPVQIDAEFSTDIARPGG